LSSRSFHKGALDLGRTRGGRHSLLAKGDCISKTFSHPSRLQESTHEQGQPLIQWTVAEGESNQSWVFHRDRRAFRIASRPNNLVIAAPDKPDANGPLAQLFPRGGDEELWQLVSVNQ